MSNVIRFPGAGSEGQTREPEQAVTEPTEAVTEMLKQSAAMTVISAFAFYANQGWDGGKLARQAAPALQKLLATKGVQLAL